MRNSGIGVRLGQVLRETCLCVYTIYIYIYMTILQCFTADRSNLIVLVRVGNEVVIELWTVKPLAQILVHNAQALNPRKRK